MRHFELCRCCSTRGTQRLREGKLTWRLLLGFCRAGVGNLVSRGASFSPKTEAAEDGNGQDTSSLIRFCGTAVFEPFSPTDYTNIG